MKVTLIKAIAEMQSTQTFEIAVYLIYLFE